jgi:AcrR family transcriptional regulator
MSETAVTSPSTRDRLIEAAGELFAELGFQEVTVRQICLKAGANIAAVNYHFRDKDSLYREVVIGAYRTARERFPVTQGVTEKDPPEARLRAFVKGGLQRIFDDASPPWGRLIAREMVEPTPALDGLIEEGMRPQYRILTAIIREIVGPEATDTEVRRCCASVMGQTLMYHSCRNIMQRMLGADIDGKDQIDELTDHIVRFSMSAMRAMRRPSATGQNGTVTR